MSTPDRNTLDAADDLICRAACMVSMCADLQGDHCPTDIREGIEITLNVAVEMLESAQRLVQEVRGAAAIADRGHVESTKEVRP